MQSADPRLFARALAAFQNARYDEAERDFKKILRADPKQFGALNLYAILLIQTGRFAEAEPLLRKAIALNSGSDACFYNFGLVLKQLKKPAEAFDALTRAIALKPDNAETWNNRGTVFNDLGRYAEAVADFDHALSIHPHYAEALSNKGRSLLLMERYDDSAAAYDRALQIQPGLAEAWAGRGTVHVRRRHWSAALADFENALKIRADFAEALVGAANSLSELGRHEDSARTFERALGLSKENPDAWIGLAHVLHRLGRPEKALEAGRAAIKAAPRAPDILTGYGNLLARLRMPDEALAAFDAALEINADHADALIGRGNILREKKDYADALAAYDRALGLRASAEAHVGRGNVLSSLKRFDEALAEYGHAAAINPDLAEARLGQGLALLHRREFDAANAALRKAIELNADLAQVWTGYALSMKLTQQDTESLRAYDCALEIDPELAEAWLGRSSALTALKRIEDAKTSIKKAMALKPDLPFALGELLYIKALDCDWSDYEAERLACITDVERGLPTIVALQSMVLGLDSEQQLACAKTFAAGNFYENPDRLWRQEKYRHERLRVAYLSPDFKEHPVAYLSAGVFEHHDRSRFETTAISTLPTENSAMSARLIKAFDRFVDCYGFSSHEIGQLIRDREIDILVDLGGHTAGARIDALNYRPAPVQATYLGYPGTTAVEGVDYLIADPTVIPADQQPFYTEKIAYLPDCYLPNDRTRAIGARPSRAAAGLPDTGFVFCSFNQAFKITPVIFDVWMRLLRAVPGSILWLPKFSEVARANLRRETEARGVEPGRIVFAERVERQEDHLARLGLADLFLDTPNYNAHSTACDALWAGVPLLTCIGKAFAGRVGASTLRAVGLPELITASLDAYEALALKLAGDPALLAAIRAKLAAQRLTAPLFDTERFTRNLEALYLKMWERAEAGEPPASISL